MIGYVSPTDLAWAAGFFDGEGTVCAKVSLHFRGNAQHRHIRCQVGQVDREALDRFRDAVGVGAIRGPYSRSHRSPIYYYSASNIRDVRHVHSLLRPYLGSVKRAQFKQAIEIYESLQLSKKTTAARKQEIDRFLRDNPGASQQMVAAHFEISRSRVYQVVGRHWYTQKEGA